MDLSIPYSNDDPLSDPGDNSGDDGPPSPPSPPPPGPPPQGATPPDINHPGLNEALSTLSDALCTIRVDKKLLAGSSHAKLRAPDPFTGKKLEALKTWITQIMINVSQAYNSSEESAKVFHTLSYLTGSAIEYFEPDLMLGTDDPLWLNNFNLFLEVLAKNFGPIDPLGEAMDQISHLSMQSSNWVSVKDWMLGGTSGDGSGTEMGEWSSVLVVFLGSGQSDWSDSKSDSSDSTSEFKELID
ncbi:hypothetical protein FISHEDRAFT_75784 [Fistulina hepatica ATCC 64428]|uniref:DUF4939 domain-containing protein n=1 Tax=Fistulina hepatica ATCC 64428 TaxID=1128425 RepID=A0A0D7A613_9AGAR|nr:hypothetical protein FISHEDRAFT_75784 [Fistulina hepatica ATCC 64428]